MDMYAQEKADIYNKNMKEKITTAVNEVTFNPASHIQKAKLFQFMGIKAESKTSKGSDQWDRAHLEALAKRYKED